MVENGSNQDNIDMEEIIVWNAAIRIFHWAFAICVSIAWILGKFGPILMTYHFWIGYAVIGLLGFRILLGLFGPRTARFTSCVYRPVIFIEYLRAMAVRHPSNWRGHNPVGGLFVLLMLLLFAMQVLTGLIADPEDYLNVGPLAGLAGIDNARTALYWHGQLSWAVLAMVILHLCAIIFYKIWKRENLVSSMVNGRKTVAKIVSSKNPNV